MAAIKTNDSDTEYEEETDSEDENKMRIQITTKSIRSIHSEFLQNDELLLKPEYQRDMCWSHIKMNTFIETINKGLIVPNYVIYQLSSGELKKNDHLYECVDGQNRLFTLEHYIKSKPYNGKYIYWKKKNERIFYNMNETELKKLKRPNNTYRNLSREEKLKFDNFQMSFHMIETQAPLSIKIKCDIFNRLQNGERVKSWIKLRNTNNIITTTICSNNIIDKMTELKFFDKIKFKNSEPEAFNIYFLIRAFLICDKQTLLDINYLDINIKKYLEHNNGDGSPNVQLTKNINTILLPKVNEIIEFISTNDNIISILPEIAYIYTCIFINYGSVELNKLIKYFTLNTDIFNEYNDIKTYKSGHDKVTSSIKLSSIYDKMILLAYG